MTLLAVTVIGRDRPGIIAQATSALADLGGNLEDSTMTILRGHFAMVLLVTTDADLAAAEQALAPVGADGTLQVTVREVPAGSEAEPVGIPYLLSLHGADRPGIVSVVTALLASVGGNITDLSTRLTGTLYVLIAEVELPATADVATVTADLARVAEGLGVEASLRRLEPDEL